MGRPRSGDPPSARPLARRPAAQTGTGCLGRQGCHASDASASAAPPPVRVRSRHAARRTHPLGLSGSTHHTALSITSCLERSGPIRDQAPRTISPRARLWLGPKMPLIISRVLTRAARHTKPHLARVYYYSTSTEASIRVRGSKPTTQRTLQAHSPSRPPRILGRVLASTEHLRFDLFLALANTDRRFVEPPSHTF